MNYFHFVDGLFNGHGTYHYANNNNTYSGEWVKGKKSGKGKMEYGNGDVFEGEYTEGEIVNGTFIFRNGEKYIGDFFLGKFQGKGTYYYLNGDVYEGEWMNDMRNGEGKYIFNDKSEIEGTWKDNKPMKKSDDNTN